MLLIAAGALLTIGAVIAGVVWLWPDGESSRHREPEFAKAPTSGDRDGLGREPQTQPKPEGRTPRGEPEKREPAPVNPQPPSKTPDPPPPKPKPAKRDDSGADAEGDLATVRRHIAGLKSGDIKSRRSAASALAALGRRAAAATGALIEAMRLTHHDIEPKSPASYTPQWQTRIPKLRPALMGPCCEALLAIGPAGRDELLAGLQSEHRWTRYGCAWVLARLGDRSALPALVRVLTDPKENACVVAHVADQLRLLGGPGVAAAADKALSKRVLKAPEISALLRLLVKTDPVLAGKWCATMGGRKNPENIRRIATQQAGSLDDPATLKMLLQATGDDKMARAACRSLGRRRQKQALPALAAVAIDDKREGHIRAQAAWAMAHMGDPRGKPALKAFAAGKDKRAAPQAKECLEWLEKGHAPDSSDRPQDPKKFTPRFVNPEGGIHVRVD